MTPVILEPVQTESASREKGVVEKAPAPGGTRPPGALMMMRPALRNGLLLVILGLFLLSRAMTLTVFPIFNDEAIYLQYAQAIHDDFQKNKFISMHGDWTDWKPPLQYWIAAPVIQLGGDPLLAGRTVALIISFLGLIGAYLFAKEVFGRKEAVITALLYTVCPPVFFQNNQFTAETFLFSVAPFFYLAMVRMIRPGHARIPWAILGVIAGTALLLLKQSGSLLLAVAIALPLAVLERKAISDRAREAGWDWKNLALNVLLVGGVMVLSHLIAGLVLPGEFETTRQHFNSRWVLAVSELVRLPIEVWRTNLEIVAQYIGAYYSWALPILLAAFIGFASHRKNFAELSIALMCLASGGAVIFLLRQFNEYIFNTAIIVLLLPLVARTGVLIWEMTRTGRSGVARGALLVCGGIMVGHWGYQLVLMSVSPGKYVERSTPWAMANYLKGWPTGFGMKEVVTLLEEQKGRGILFADTQWGNPLTTLQIYGPTRFPNLRIVPISREFLDPNETRKLREAATRMADVRMVIFSADASDERGQWQRNIEQEMCAERREIRAYPGQMPIIVCSF